MFFTQSTDSNTESAEPGSQTHPEQLNQGVQPRRYHMCPPYFSVPSAGSISIFFRKTLTSQALQVPPFPIFLQSLLSTLYAVRRDDGSLLFCVSWGSRVPYKVVSSLRGINYYAIYFYDTLHRAWFGTGTEEAIQKYLFNYIKLKCNIEDEWDSMHFLYYIWTAGYQSKIHSLSLVNNRNSTVWGCDNTF